MKVSVFSSGSCGNSTLVISNNKKILIDVGISKKAIEENLLKSGLTLDDIDVLLITHEHDDHVRSLGAVMKKNDMPIYMTLGTYNEYLKKTHSPLTELVKCKKDNEKIKIINRIDNSVKYESIILDDVRIEVLPAFHDAVETIGFIIYENEKKLVYLTDTGYVHSSIMNDINNAEIYILESNHDPEILMTSSRPYATKRRILSDHGHLSNEDSMVCLAKSIGDKTKLVFHAHISQECNLETIVNLTRKRVFDAYGIDSSDVKFIITSPRPTGEFEI